MRRNSRLLVKLLLLGAAAFVGWWGREHWLPTPQRPVPAAAEVRQWSSLTCGPASVATLLNVYGRSWEPAKLDRQCRVTVLGSNLEDLRTALRESGLPAEALRAKTPRALLRVPRPFIAHLGTRHFEVVERVTNERSETAQFEVFDPTSGRIRRWTPAELHHAGGGWVLAVMP